MSNNEKIILDEKALENVSGGKKASSAQVDRTAEFEQAWTILGMERKGYSGMARAEMYDSWERGGFAQDATTFITLKMNSKS